MTITLKLNMIIRFIFFNCVQLNGSFPKCASFFRFNSVRLNSNGFSIIGQRCVAFSLVASGEMKSCAVEREARERERERSSDNKKY